MLVTPTMYEGAPALSFVPEARAPPKGCCPTTAPVDLTFICNGGGTSARKQVSVRVHAYGNEEVYCNHTQITSRHKAPDNIIWHHIRSSYTTQRKHIAKDTQTGIKYNIACSRVGPEVHFRRGIPHRRTSSSVQKCNSGNGLLHKTQHVRLGDGHH